EADELATVGVGVAEGLAAVGAGMAVLVTDNPARGTPVPPCPGRGRTVGGLKGTSVAVGVAVGSGGSTVGVSGGSGSAAMGVSAGGSVGVPFSASSPDGVSPPGPGGSGVALGCGSVPGSAAGGSSDASAGVGATVSSCGADVAVSVDVAVSA